MKPKDDDEVEGEVQVGIPGVQATHLGSMVIWMGDVPHRCMYLKSWSTVALFGDVTEPLGDLALLKEVQHCV